MGIPSFNLTSSVSLIIAQRLVRTICPHCKTMEPVNDEWIAKLKKVDLTPDDVGGQVAFGEGCDECFHSGYAGRTAIYEFLPVTEDLRTEVMNGASASEIKKTAVQRGLITLRMDGQDKIRDRQTTPDEVLRVTQLDVE